MAIPSRQIGWSTQSNLLWQISKRLELLIKVMGANNTTTTTTSSTSTSTSTSSTTTTTTTLGPNLIRIGTQIWTTKNLNVTTYKDGTLISESDWDYYENNPANGEIFGKLYKGNIINDPRGLAPVGYHIPTDAEWTILIDYLGGPTVAGGKMKSTDATWQIPNIGATNESGFTGLAAGFFQGFNGAFNNQSSTGYFWSSSELETDSTKLWARYLQFGNDDAFRFSPSKINGFSVRLIKD